MHLEGLPGKFSSLFNFSATPPETRILSHLMSRAGQKSRIKDQLKEFTYLDKKIFLCVLTGLVKSILLFNSCQSSNMQLKALKSSIRKDISKKYGRSTKKKMKVPSNMCHLLELKQLLPSSKCC